MKITGRTRLVGIIGDPIVQVRSPALFNAMFAEASFEAVCVAYEVGDGELPRFFDGIKLARNVDALFATTPHKRTIAPLLDDLTATASTVGSVNAARREQDGLWRGAMFDGVGCVLGLRAHGIEVGRRRVLLLGCGGAGRAIAMAMAAAGAQSLMLIDDDASAAQELAVLLQDHYPGCEASIGSGPTAEHDIFINASTLGMNSGDPSPFAGNLLAPNSVVVDLVCEPGASPLGAVAGEVGCTAFGGSLVHQGQSVFAAKFIGLDYWPLDWTRVPFQDLIDF